MWIVKWFGGRAEVQEEDEPARHPPVQISVKPPQAAPVNSLQAAKRSPATGFDPYNSGAFERRQAWERIKRR